MRGISVLVLFLVPFLSPALVRSLICLSSILSYLRPLFSSFVLFDFGVWQGGKRAGIRRISSGVLLTMVMNRPGVWD